MIEEFGIILSRLGCGQLSSSSTSSSSSSSCCRSSSSKTRQAQLMVY